MSEEAMNNDTSTTAAWLLLFCFVPSSLATALATDLPNKGQTAEIRALKQAQTECSRTAPIEVIHEGKRTCIYQRIAHAGVTKRIPAQPKNNH